MQLSILTQFLCQTLDSVPNREISQIKRSIHRFSMSHHPIFRSLCRLPSQNGRADGCRRHREAQPDRSDSRTADREIRAEEGFFTGTPPCPPPTYGSVSFRYNPRLHPPELPHETTQRGASPSEKPLATSVFTQNHISRRIL